MALNKLKICLLVRIFSTRQRCQRRTKKNSQSKCSFTWHESRNFITFYKRSRNKARRLFKSLQKLEHSHQRLVKREPMAGNLSCNASVYNYQHTQTHKFRNSLIVNDRIILNAKKRQFLSNQDGWNLRAKADKRELEIAKLKQPIAAFHCVSFISKVDELFMTDARSISHEFDSISNEVASNLQHSNFFSFTQPLNLRLV